MKDSQFMKLFTGGELSKFQYREEAAKAKANAKANAKAAAAAEAKAS